jgi:hypothetical protein
METLFPFGFPLPTAFYLVLYLATWVLHAVFMAYVIAGTGYLVYACMCRREASEGCSTHGLAAVLLDWMPFAVSAAVTAGVAPLLFLQILHQDSFYTANLLLFHRWMSILPVLILGAYTLYLLILANSRGFSRRLRSLLATLAFGCFLFTAYSWTENHLLSLARMHWPTFYASGSIFYLNRDLLPRLLFLLAGCVPTMLLMVLWQMRWYEKHCCRPAPAGETRKASRLALFALGVTAAAFVFYVSLAGDPIRGQCLSFLAGPWVLLGVGGLVLEGWGWRRLLGGASLTARLLGLLTVGTTLRWLGTAIVRETARLATADLPTEFARHEQAYRVGGFSTFLAFALLNGLLLVLCGLVVSRGLKRNETACPLTGEPPAPPPAPAVGEPPAVLEPPAA